MSSILILSLLQVAFYAAPIRTACPTPRELNAIPESNSENYDVGSYVIWKCADGFKMAGSANARVRVCMENNTWSKARVACSVFRCPEPPIPAFALPVSSKLPPGRTHFPVNDTITYKCTEGNYHLSVEDGLATNVCGQDGLWRNSIPSCNRHCPNMATVLPYSNHVCFNRSGRMKWEESRNLCEQKGQILATVKDGATQRFLARELPRVGGENSFWIGAKRGRDWTWNCSGDFISEIFWKENFPDEDEDKKCLAFVKDNGASWWEERSCSDEYGIICENESESEVACGRGVFDSRGRCLHFRSGTYNWEAGRDECRKGTGRFLAEIQDNITQNILNGSTDASPAGVWWIGGSDADNSSVDSWFWHDNTRLEYVAWSASQSVSNGNAGNRDVCLLMDQSTSYNWKKNDCEFGNNHGEAVLTLCQIGYSACGDPGEPLHGTRYPKGYTTYNESATIKFVCNTGYHLTGEESITCRPNGTWSADKPTCEAVECTGNASTVVNIAYTNVISNTYRGITVYTCKSGYIPDGEPVSICQNDRSWSSPSFACTLKTAQPETDHMATIIAGRTDITTQRMTAGRGPTEEATSQITSRTSERLQSTDSPKVSAEMSTTYRTTTENGANTHRVDSTSHRMTDSGQTTTNLVAGKSTTSTHHASAEQTVTVASERSQEQGATAIIVAVVTLTVILIAGLSGLYYFMKSRAKQPGVPSPWAEHHEYATIDGYCDVSKENRRVSGTENCLSDSTEGRCQPGFLAVPDSGTRGIEAYELEGPTPDLSEYIYYDSADKSYDASNLVAPTGTNLVDGFGDKMVENELYKSSTDMTGELICQGKVLGGGAVTANRKLVRKASGEGAHPGMVDNDIYSPSDDTGPSPFYHTLDMWEGGENGVPPDCSSIVGNNVQTIGEPEDLMVDNILYGLSDNYHTYQDIAPESDGPKTDDGGDNGQRL